MKKIALIFGVMAMILLSFFYTQAEESVWQVTEVMANAVDEDTGEFVELKYNGVEDQYLSGWTLSDGKENDNLIDFGGEFDAGKAGLVVSEGNVVLIVDSDYAGQYNEVFDEVEEIDLSTVVMITVEDGEIGNGLANAGDEVVVKDSEGNVVVAFVWSSDSGNGVSWERVGDEWVKCGLEGGNSFGFLNEKLPITNSQFPIESQNEEEQEESESQNENNWERFWEGGEDPVRINELMINPVGDDGVGEWIELKSYWEEDIDLSGWWICDNKCSADSKEGGYEIGEVVLESGGFVVLERVDTKIALNNDVDSVWLYDPNHDWVSGVDYDLVAKEGESYGWDNGLQGWRETMIVKKNLENEFDENGEEVSSSKDQDSSVEEDNIESEKQVKDTNEEKYLELESIGEVKTKTDGVRVSFEGVVTAGWNLLENKYLWMQDGEAGIGVKFEEDPKFAVGDKVWIAGERHDLTYRQTVLAEDWKRLGGEKIEAVKFANFEDNEDMLVKIVGNITQTSGDDFYLNDGSAEYRVYIKENTGIIKPEMKKGDSFEIMGVVNEIKSGYRILPRYQEDVVKSNQLKVLPSVGYNIMSIFTF